MKPHIHSLIDATIAMPPAAPTLSTVSTAATLYLMSQYARSPCPLVAYAITDQLRRLAESSTENLSPVIQRLAMSLMPLWHDVARSSSGSQSHWSHHAH